MAIDKINVGTIGGYVDGVWEDEAFLFAYDYDTTTGKAVTIYFRNRLREDCHFVVRSEATREIIYQRPLPKYTNDLLTRPLPSSQRPIITGMEINLHFGETPTSRRR